MKIYRYIQNYKVQILEESFVLNDENTLVNTAKISFYDINNNLIDTKKYGVVDLDNIYNKILNKELQNFPKNWHCPMESTDTNGSNRQKNRQKTTENKQTNQLDYQLYTKQK